MAHFPLAKRRAFLYKVFRRAEVAQLVEQGTENPRVGSSILSLGTIFRARNVVPGFFFFRRERTGTMFRSSPPGGTAGTTLPPQKVEFPFRPAPAFRPVFKASPETHTRPHLPPAERRKTATPARTSPLNARLPRTALHASYGVMAAPLSPAPPHALPLLPRPSSVVSRSRLRRLPALSCSSGRVPTLAALGESRRPSAPRPAPRPSFLTLVARAFRRTLFPRFFPFARFPPPSSRPSLFAARLHHAPHPASGALRRPDAERLRRPKPPQPLSGKKEEKNDAGSAQKRVSGQVLRTRSETEK